MLLHIYMVAGSYWPPALRAGGLRVDPWALGPTFVDMTDELNKTAASLPLWKDEKPTTGEVRKWLEDAEPLLTAPQRALINGVEPASHVKYRPVSVPPLLVVSAADGVTAAMVATNDRAIQTALDTNAERAATKDAAIAEISSGLFAALERAVQPNAPLLLTELKASCKQAAPFDAYYDGKAAWQALKAMSEADAALPGEDNVHDAHFTKLIISPLPNDATPAQFSARVSTAMKYHAPYLSRPFPTPKAFSQWVVQQTPEKHRLRAQDRFDALTAAEQNNAHGVAAMIVKLLAESRPMSAVLKDSDLKEFVGVADDDDGANSGRRPSGLGKGKGGGGGGGGGGGKGGRGGRGGGGKGSGGGGGGTSGRGRATGCSTPPPRGPTCDHAHHGECWRDPKVTKIPQRVFDDARAIAKIKADRIVQGNRLGETVAELTPIAPTEEVVAMVEEEIDAQWPGVADDDDVVDDAAVALAAAMRVDARSAGEASAAPAAAPGLVDIGSTAAQVVVGGAALPAQCVPCAPSAVASSPTVSLNLATGQVAWQSRRQELAVDPAPSTGDTPAMTDAQRARAEGNRANALQIQLDALRLQLQTQQRAGQDAGGGQGGADEETAVHRALLQTAMEAPPIEVPSVQAVPMGAPVEQPAVTLAYWPARQAISALTPESPIEDIRRVVGQAGLRVPTNVGGNSPSRTPGRRRNRRDILIEARQELNIDTPDGWGLPAGAVPAAIEVTLGSNPSQGEVLGQGGTLGPNPNQGETLDQDETLGADETLRLEMRAAVVTLLVFGQPGDVVKADELRPASMKRARAALRSHAVQYDGWDPSLQKAAAWVVEYVSPPRDHSIVRYVADNPMRRHALGLIRDRLLRVANARDSVDSMGNYEVFVTFLRDAAEVYLRAVREGRQLFDDNGGDHDDADHSAVLLEPVVPEELAVLVPLRPLPGTTAGVALTVAERLHAFSAPLARFLLFITGIISVLIFHEHVGLAFMVAVNLGSHLFTHVLGHGGADHDYDFNVSLYDMAVAPPNVLEEARAGNPVAVGVLTSIVMILAYNHQRCARAVRQLWRAANRLTTEFTLFMVLLIFVWVCVWRASAHEEASGEALAQRRLLPEIINRAALHPVTTAAIHQCTGCAHGLFERWNGTVHIDFESGDEIIAILGASSAMMAVVWDTGSRRHVVKSSSEFVPGTEKPCPFRIRGINTGGRQPKSMGDVDRVFPIWGGGTVTHRCKDAVCIEEAPHGIVGAGLLEEEGLCDWRGELLNGKGRVYLENHRFLLMPYCKPGQTTHDFDDKADGVMFVGGNRGLDVVKPNANVSAGPRPLPKGAHWSKSVFADQLLRQGLDGAKEYLADMKRDYDMCIAHGPHESREVGASHYYSRGPYWMQFVAEQEAAVRSLEVPPASSTSATPPTTTAQPAALPALPSHLLYWFSGPNLTETGVAAQWREVAGGECIYRDTKLDASHTLLNDEVFWSDMRAIGDGTITRGLFAVPCGTFSVSRYRPHPRVRVLREAGPHILGLPDLNATDRAAVNVANILVQRTCDAVRALAARGGVWIVENPVRRNDVLGPWKRFNSGKFPKHGSLWQMPAILDLARDLDARVAHVPLCWFEHDESDVCKVEQKYITLMFSPQLEPALRFLRNTRCAHLAHAKVAVGFDSTGASRGAPTGRYPPELNRIVVRALAFPGRCASDAAWADCELVATYDADAAAQSADAVAQVDTEDVPPQRAEHGITGDRHAGGAGAKVARGHSVNLRQLNSRQVHEMFVHKPADVLRLLPKVCADVPAEWSQLRDLDDACPDCLAGKHTHFGSHSGLPDVTAPGEIIAFDLLILRTPDLFTGGTIIFGAIDLYSDWDVLIKIKYKTEVPECMREVLRICASHDITVGRMHTHGWRGGVPLRRCA